MSGSEFKLVLSGGGLKGLSHVGVLLALEERGLVPSLVVGSSMGAMVAATWATGMSGAEMRDQVPESEKDDRLQRLQSLLSQHQREFAVSLLGREIDLLIEKPGREAGQRVGRSPWLQPVIVDETTGEIGDIVKVRIIRAGSHSLHAAVV